MINCKKGQASLAVAFKKHSLLQRSNSVLSEILQLWRCLLVKLVKDRYSHIDSWNQIPSCKYFDKSRAGTGHFFLARAGFFFFFFLWAKWNQSPAQITRDESWIPKKIILVTTHWWSSAPMLLSLLLLYFQKVYRVGTNCVPTLLFISDNPELLRNFRNWLGFHLG